MCEEYLSSKEIVQKIADLKIRLALQQEFEQEVAGMAYMHLSDPVSNFGFTFGFYCNSVIYGDLLNVFARSGYSPKSES